MVNEPGHQYSFNKVGLGYGKKVDFMRLKYANESPAPKYDAHIKDSITYQSVKNNPKTLNGFYNKFDKYEGICYKGMEKSYFGKESQGPGAYMPMEQIYDSSKRSSSKYTVSK